MNQAIVKADLQHNVDCVEAELLETVPQIFDECSFTSDAEIIADWLKSKSDLTGKSYYSTIKQLFNFLHNTPVKQWTKQMILAYIEDCKQKNKIATVKRKLTCIRSFLSHCVQEEYLTKNVARNIGKIRENKDDIEKQSLTHTERIIGSKNVWKIIDSVTDKRNHLLLKVTYLLALRAHEAIKIQWNDITPDGNNYKIKIIGKNNKIAFLPIHSDLVDELKEISTDGYVFKSRKGQNKPMSKTQLHRILKNAVLENELDSKISTHWLRHQRCSDLVNSGKYTLSQVQKFMRHSSPTITSTYIHVKNEIGSDALL